MTFKLRDFVKRGQQLIPKKTVTYRAVPEVSLCPTGKTPFNTKREARKVSGQANRGQRTNMTVFRCGYCAKYHLGHRRGAIY